MAKNSKNNADKRHSYQNDPRYKAFYDKMKESQKPAGYDEEIQPMTLDELDSADWDSTVRPGHRPPAPTPIPPTRPQPAKTKASMPPQSSSSGGDDLGPGVILGFDDGSVAVYKDAVSGKDYALFYFLEPDGTLAPRGIFLEQYDRQRIGELPETLFANMIAQGRWDRDAVIFHLDGLQFTAQIRALENRTPAANHFSLPAPPSQSASGSATGTGTDTGTGSGLRERTRPAPPRRPDASTAPPNPPPARDPLERGRELRINVGGRVWESVYWTTDEIGPIVAHATNREWALMHLDLGRFKDALEYGEIVSYEKLAEIEASLAAHHA